MLSHAVSSIVSRSLPQSSNFKDEVIEAEEADTMTDHECAIIIAPMIGQQQLAISHPTRQALT